MTTSNLTSPPDRVLTIGPRGLDVLRLLWEHGPATVRQLLTWLTSDPPLTYMNIMTVCVRLTEKGLLERRRATSVDESARYGQAYVYAPTVSEEEFKRLAVRQQNAGNTTEPLATDDLAHLEHALAYLGTFHSGNDRVIDDAVLQRIAALLERAETAERAAATWEARAHHAELHIQAVEQRAMAAKARAEQAERRLETLQKQLNRPPRPRATPHPPHEVIIEHRSPGVCRVCGVLAPRPRKRRKDGLRVCAAESCIAEAQRRDNLAKRRRFLARQQSRKDEGGTMKAE